MEEVIIDQFADCINFLEGKPNHARVNVNAKIYVRSWIPFLISLCL